VPADFDRGTKPSIAVIGGGIAGLTTAYEILERSQRQERGVDVLCLEASDRPGGNIRSTREDGFLYEWAANGFLDNAPATVTLVRRLGLEDRVLKAQEAAEKRFIFRKGRLREVPMTPPAFLTSGILSLPGKLRLMLEPVIPSRRSDAEESVFDFASRRIGPEAASVLVDAMVSGIYAGNVKRLSLEGTFPKMRAMERDHGTLFRAMLAKRKEAAASGKTAGGPSGPGGRLTSFKDGLQELVDTLGRAVGPNLKLSTPVTRLSSMGLRGFRINPREGKPLDVDAVVLACPAWTAAGMVESVDRELSRTLGSIPSASLSVVHLGFRLKDLGRDLDGFGFLVPRGQGPRVLGVLWASSIFEQRAPDDSVLLTAMIGGAHDPGTLDLDDGSLLGVVRDDLRKTMGVAADPCFMRVVRHPRGIPQYDLGHMQRLATIDERLGDLPGLWLAGNSYRGIAINACVEEAPRIAESVLEYVNRRDDLTATHTT